MENQFPAYPVPCLAGMWTSRREPELCKGHTQLQQLWAWSYFLYNFPFSIFRPQHCTMFLGWWKHSLKESCSLGRISKTQGSTFTFHFGWWIKERAISWSFLLPSKACHGEEAGYDIKDTGLKHHQSQLKLLHSPCLVLRVAYYT